ncbi:MAG: HAD family hydrolase [Nitrospira sp.]|jgi:FMN phosphatase YigB (HAD superfamily)|nr:haloacid dehalogenase-like hydrolase [Nitrospira sp.]MBP6604143.1 haloacid dehalogenase-like hydrolase [Nitrospira sp.]HQY58190.1 haloacid dehalogenase-like hydrolase [Nitrospira sp.]HRA96431.1 haloacid dehalogenase-like hydrolase [Nitrospira sp.]
MISPTVVVLFDVDNTLLDNDQVTADLKQHLEQEVGPAHEQEYWRILEELREELGYADYLGALQRYRLAYPHDSHLLAVSRFLVNYPFSDRLFPRALDVVRHARQWGRTVILTDGDAVFQPLKIEQSGILSAVEEQVLIYVHKELELKDVEQRYPADHYVLVDDKLRILTAVKAHWGARVTTVFPRQGHYATDPEALRTFPAADLAIDRIADLLTVDHSTLFPAAGPR